MKKICRIAAAVFLVCSCASSPKNTVPPSETESSVLQDMPLDASDAGAADNFMPDEQPPEADNAPLPETPAAEASAELPPQENEPSAAQDFIPIFADDALRSNQSAPIDDRNDSADEKPQTYSIIPVPSADTAGIEERYGTGVTAEKPENHAASPSAEQASAAKPPVRAALPSSDSSADSAPESSSPPQQSAPAPADIRGSRTEDTEDAAPPPDREEDDAEELFGEHFVKKGQIIDVYCSGQGWIFAKKTGDTRAVSYSGKKRDGDDTVFSFSAKEQGTVSLYFSRTDPLSGKKTDYLAEIQVADISSANPGRVAVPFDPEAQVAAAEPAEKKAEEPAAERAASSEQADASDVLSLPEQHASASRDDGTLAQNAPDIASEAAPFAESSALPPAADIASDSGGIQPHQSESETDFSDPLFSSIYAEPDVEIVFPPDDFDADSAPESGISADELLDEAAICYENKEYPQALALLEQFFAKSVRRLDEGWFLRGQIYEAEDKQGNIKRALDAYSLLVSNYQGSALWKKASERIIYLNRFYFNIR
ncbi:MAG: hypothetical protein NC041_06070 [Bacteroides sp.]|nr:hypothetical protein [Prevotella sp.]MCM1407522.1 hypothetical protein [Treponema brennaborense]MCM1470012.1 hypothetical protein [Bacteroides sp.]